MTFEGWGTSWGTSWQVITTPPIVLTPPLSISLNSGETTIRLDGGETFITLITGETTTEL